jgi:hypothetical protein
MKTLIHNNGKMITINKIARSEDKVYFTNYDNGVLKTAGVPTIDNPDGKCNIDKDVVPTEYMNYNNYMDWLAEQSVLIDKPSYALAGANNVNWVFNKGAGNVDNTVRVYIPFETVGASTSTEDALYTWLETVAKPIKAYRTSGKMGIVQYLTAISESELTMFAAYPEVIIDYKE